MASFEILEIVRMPQRQNVKTRYIVLLSVGLIWFWSLWGDLLAGHLSAVFTQELSNNDVARAGQWGDSFGALNALASAAAFTVVLATLIVQANAIRGQAQDLHRQRFESSFFELLRLMRQLRDEISFTFSEDFKTSMSTKYPGSPVLTEDHCGFEGVRAANLEVYHWIRGNKHPTRQEFSEIYTERVHKRHEMTIAPYFRLIYTILNRIMTDKVLSQDEKYWYGNLLRSQLTSEELKLLAVNGLAPVSKDLDKLIIEFRMLKYLPSSSVRNKLKNVYPEEAFSARD